MTFLNAKIKESLIILFVREFSIMIEAGLPIISSLEILYEHQRDKKFADTIKQVKEAIEKGETIADAFSEFPKYFDRFFIGMIAAGEASGRLDTILKSIADYKERNFKLKKKIKSAMTYPIILFIVSIIVVAFILIYVIPVFKNVFSSSGDSLPYITEVVIRLSEFVKKYFYFMSLGFFILYLLFLKLKKIEQINFIIDKAILKLPVIGDFFVKIAVAKFAHTTGILLKSGVSIIDSFAISAKTVGNKVIEKGLAEVRSDVIKGEGLADSLEKAGVFPDMVCQMVLVGENVGAIDITLSKIAEFYNEQIELSLETVVSMIEPVMILFLGVIIGFLLLAMYLPVFNIAGGI
ncbi:MAG: type II secretion system F family protein [Deltaproteobacteria bacterium]|nr:type II secretion system F family protein [Deltaproteobacteria bacterium]